LGRIVSFDEFEKDIRHIISEADARGIPIRTMGAAAIRIHSPNNKDVYERLKRDPKHTWVS
jgi:hypothetical protein